MTYKGSNWTRGELGNVPDPNAPVPCVVCDHEYPFRSYWKGRYVDPDGVDPAAIVWICDDCIEQARTEYELHRHRQQHRQLGEFA